MQKQLGQADYQFFGSPIKIATHKNKDGQYYILYRINQYGAQLLGMQNGINNKGNKGIKTQLLAQI